MFEIINDKYYWSVQVQHCIRVVNIGNNCYTSYARCNTTTGPQVILLYPVCMHSYVSMS